MSRAGIVDSWTCLFASRRLVRFCSCLRSSRRRLPSFDPCEVRDPPKVYSLDRSNALAVRPFYAAAGAAGRLVVAGAVLAGILQAAGVLTHPAAAETLRITDGATRCAAAPQQRTMWQDLEDGVVCRVTAFGRVPGRAFTARGTVNNATEAPWTGRPCEPMARSGAAGSSIATQLTIIARDRAARINLAGWTLCVGRGLTT